MAGEVVLGKGNELGRSGSACAGEDLLVNVAGEVLDPYLAEAGFGWYWEGQFGRARGPLGIAYQIGSPFSHCYLRPVVATVL